MNSSNVYWSISVIADLVYILNVRFRLEILTCSGHTQSLFLLYVENPLCKVPSYWAFEYHNSNCGHPLRNRIKRAIVILLFLNVPAMEQYVFVKRIAYIFHRNNFLFVTFLGPL